MSDYNKSYIKNGELILLAKQATMKAYELSMLKDDWKYMGYVGAALITEQGNTYTGVNLTLMCGIGFCAEHSAVAEMIKNGETRIHKIVAVTNDNVILSPCGRCRELIYQVDESNVNTLVILGHEDTTMHLGELLPDNWQKRIGI
jgi:cytidine deaminase